MDPVERLLAKFDHVQRTSSGWLVRCPAHEDNSPSLHISRGDDGRALLKCFTGCSTDSICSSLGIQIAELFEGEKEELIRAETGVSIPSLAQKVGLPVDYLRQLGLKQCPGYVGIPYRDYNGQQLFLRQRHSLSKGGRFRQPSGVKAIPYGREKLDHARKKGGLVLVEGECVTAEHEVLTQRGWVSMPYLREGDLVAQWEPIEVSFVHPIAIHRRPWAGKLYQISTNRNQIDQVVTANHKLVAIDYKSRVYSWEAQDGIPPGNKYIPKGGIVYGIGIDLDGECPVCRHHLEEARLAPEVALSWDAIVHADAGERTEMLQWVKAMGRRLKGRDLWRVYTNSQHFADWVQALCHTSGISCSIMGDNQITLTIAPKNTRVRTTQLEFELTPSPGEVWCVTVPSGAFLVRHRGVVSVTGNSDCWTLWYHGIPALGIPGASSFKSLEKADVNDIDKVFLVKETDKGGEQFVSGAGKYLAQELGFKGEIRVIDMAKSKQKDPNDLYRQDPQAFIERFNELAKRATRWSERKLNFKLASEIEAEQVKWLWEPYIPFGYLTLLWGKGGIGKSYLTSQLIGLVSSGGTMPLSDQRHEPMRVLLYSAEEDMAQQIRPHLDEAGADLSNVAIFDLDEEDFEFHGHYLEDLKAAIEQFDARVVIFDPVVEFMSKSDINKADQVRRCLAPLKNIARQYGVAIILVHHQKKGQLTQVSDGAMGSADFRNAMRSALFVMPEPGSRGEVLILAHDKHNLTAPGESIRFRVNRETEKFEWLGYSRFRPDELLAEAALPLEELEQVNEATIYLANRLIPIGYSVKCQDIFRECRERGITKRHLFIAKIRLGVKSAQREDYVTWYLEEDPKLESITQVIVPREPGIDDEDGVIEEGDLEEIPF